MPLTRLSSDYACPMTQSGKLTGSRASRIVWGVLAVLLAMGLAGATVMAGRALTDEKQVAQQRAAFLTNTVLFNALTPEMVSKVMFGPDYRSLIITAQGKILADDAIGPDAIARVRIWGTDGTLIFSNDQRDKIGEYVARGNPQIDEALRGDTVSLLTDAQVAPRAGLAGSPERLYETFVPLHLPNQIGVLAVVQIDTRYSAILAAANRVWRPVQIGLLAALVLALLLFVRSLRAAPVAGRVAKGAPPAGLAEADTRVRRAEKAAEQADERVRKAEQTAKQHEEKLAMSEQQVRDSLAVARGLEEDSKVAATRMAALEAELERLRGLAAAAAEPSKDEEEVSRLTAALKESELERGRATQEVRRVLEAVATLEVDLAQARGEAKQALAEAKKSKDAKEKRATAELTKAQEGLREATAELAEAQKTAQVSEGKHGQVAAELDQVRSSLAEREKSLAEREQAFAKMQAEAKRAREQLAAAEERSAAAESKVAELESAAEPKVAEPEPEAGKTAELEARVRELEDARRKEIVEFQSAQERLANSQAELISMTKRAKEAEGELKRARAAAAEAPAPAAREPETYQEPAYGPAEPTLAGRLARLSRSSEEEPSEEPEAPAAPAEEGESEAESLRSRLARAAAARHRTSAPPGSSSERDES